MPWAGCVAHARAARWNRTTDAEINQFAENSKCVVANKDRDFLDCHLVTGLPSQLLWVTTGNIANDELIALFESQLANQAAFSNSNCVELSVTGLTIHR